MPRLRRLERLRFGSLAGRASVAPARRDHRRRGGPRRPDDRRARPGELALARDPDRPELRMTAIAPPDIHDAETLAAARALLDAAADPQQMQREVLAAVARNEQWRGHECINLLAPEALMSPTVRAAALRRGRPARRRGPHRPGQPLVRRHQAHRRDRVAVRRAAQAPVQEQLRRAPAGREHDRQHGRLRRADRARRHGDDDPAAGRRPFEQPPRRPGRHPRPEHRRRPVRRRTSSRSTSTRSRARASATARS